MYAPPWERPALDPAAGFERSPDRISTSLHGPKAAGGAHCDVSEDALKVLETADAKLLSPALGIVEGTAEMDLAVLRSMGSGTATGVAGP